MDSLEQLKDLHKIMFSFELQSFDKYDEAKRLKMLIMSINNPLLDRDFICNCFNPFLSNDVEKFVMDFYLTGKINCDKQLLVDNPILATVLRDKCPADVAELFLNRVLDKTIDFEYDVNIASLASIFDVVLQWCKDGVKLVSMVLAQFFSPSSVINILGVTTLNQIDGLNHINAIKAMYRGRDELPEVVQSFCANSLRCLAPFEFNEMYQYQAIKNLYDEDVFSQQFEYPTNPVPLLIRIEKKTRVGGTLTKDIIKESVTEALEDGELSIDDASFILGNSIGDSVILSI